MDDFVQILLFQDYCGVVYYLVDSIIIDFCERLAFAATLELVSTGCYSSHN